jgi:hypothetical protein
MACAVETLEDQQSESEFLAVGHAAQMVLGPCRDSIEHVNAVRPGAGPSEPVQTLAGKCCSEDDQASRNRLIGFGIVRDRRTFPMWLAECDEQS